MIVAGIGMIVTMTIVLNEEIRECVR